MSRRDEKSEARTILWVDDDQFRFAMTKEFLEEEGYRVLTAQDASEALDVVKENGDRISLVIVDIMMPPGGHFGDRDTLDGHRTGLVLAREIHRLYPGLPLLGCSVIRDPDVLDWFRRYGVGFLQKPHTPEEMKHTIEKIVRGKTAKKGPRCFIVHGRDTECLLELKNYLQNKLGFDEPTVLREMPSLGRTIIEKFEHASEVVDLVFVLLTADDEIHPSSATGKRRARQNVIFELGFFYAKMQRASGRIRLLHQGPVDLPSDLSGVVYIDISQGVLAAGEEIRTELRGWL